MADTARTAAVLREVGALLGHRDPEAFAYSLLNPCQHNGQWTFDPNEVCDPPCGRRHEWCACGRPMKPPCPIVEESP